MKKLITYFLAFIYAGLGMMLSCNPEAEPELSPDKGAADFSVYVAIGNSGSAGMQNNGLRAEYQLNSFPNILARQIRSTGFQGEFKQPLLAEGETTGNLKLTDFSNGMPVISSDPGTANAFLNVSSEGPFNNLGVPGMPVRFINTSSGTVRLTNPFFSRMFPETETDKSYIDYCIEKNPTFVTIELGINDVLLYASSGGKYGVQGDLRTGLFGITSPEEFVRNYSTMLNRLYANNSDIKGVLTTVADPTFAPFFNTSNELLRSSRSLPLQLSETEAVMLNIIYELGGYRAPDGSAEIFIVGGNYPVIQLGDSSSKIVRRFDAALGDYALQTIIPKLPRIISEGLGYADLENDSSNFALALVPIMLRNDSLRSEAELLSGLENEKEEFEKQINNTNDEIRALDSLIANETDAEVLTSLNIERTGLLQNLETQEARYGVILQNWKTKKAQTELLAAEIEQLKAPLRAEAEARATPFPTEFVLDGTEAGYVRTAIQEYNSFIGGQAKAYGMGLLDADELVRKIYNGVSIGGLPLNAAFISGGFYSLDGIHPTSRGQAYIANQFIEAIGRAGYGAHVPPVNVNDYKGVHYPE
ncbi:MAG: hypothetical protein MI784_15655 [Cytophagales bacterium]|nr:hypothetical protein [Cytophagales bacterium]